MYNGKTVSVVMATYKEKDSVRRVIEEFFNTLSRRSYCC